MTCSAIRPRQFVLLVALLGLVIVGGATASAAHGQTGASGAASTGPNLTGVAAVAQDPGTFTVTGDAFTPGGEVYVALYDQWGATLHENRSTIAAPVVHGPNGSADPALGFRRGGALSETFGGLCGTTPMVRAYDQQAELWSNWLNISVPEAGLTVFGANGSRDPAIGFRPGC